MNYRMVPQISRVLAAVFNTYLFKHRYEYYRDYFIKVGTKIKSFSELDADKLDIIVKCLKSINKEIDDYH